ncbi:TIGR02996 domain-containing protein [Gemmata sp. G18]|uniref:TIGR02996 domain-containing protein n=1 Tax=Gemmata palustris TaxID=2822762 RepID=A0ABS5C188_9BACT|nr:TIGR02996 domain-containing protein [Gemmata palustris]MBP3958888.1 TIGR02996 domain-containing protein [Gemmata palustris]
MSDESALLTAILAHPDEDTPRLVFADWLDENGQPERAEFIRLQIKYVRGGDTNPQAHSRLLHLLSVHERTWLGFVAEGDEEWHFRRGFPEQLTINVRDLLARWEVFASVGSLRDLCVIGGRKRTVEELVRARWAPSWKRFSLHADFAYDGGLVGCEPMIVNLASCPQVSRLEELNLTGFEVSPRAAHALTTSEHLVPLARLCFRSVVWSSETRAVLSNRFGDRLHA